MADTVFGATEGAEVRVHVRPDRTIDFWVSVGTGWRGLWLTTTPAGTPRFRASSSRGLKVGVDYRVSAHVSLAPVIGGSVDMFVMEATPTSMGYTQIADKTVPSPASPVASTSGIERNHHRGDEDTPIREITHRTSGIEHVPITRLVSPSDLGEVMKPFVFLDHVVFDGSVEPLERFWHPHSGIATVTVPLDGATRVVDMTRADVVLPSGRIEWMRAGSGVWHTGQT